MAHVTLKSDREYILKTGQRFTTMPPRDMGQTLELPNLLRANKIAFTDNRVDSANLLGFLLSTGIAVGTWIWLAKFSEVGGSGGGLGGLMGIGKSKPRSYTP